MLSYALKRIVRSWKLYASLILGMMLAATFFGGINVGADTIGKQALDAELVNTPVDISLTPMSGGVSVPRSSFDNVVLRTKQVSGVVAAEPVGSETQQFYPYNESIPYIKAIQDSSLLYQHLTILNGREIANANESVINADSKFAQSYKLGQTVRYSFGQTGQRNNLTLILKVVGEVQLDNIAVNTLGVSPIYYGPQGTTPTPGSTLIVSWDKTFNHMFDWAYNQTRFGRYYPIAGIVNVYLDRPKLLSAFNVEGSIAQVQQIDDQVANVAALNGFNSSPNLINPLLSFSTSIFALRLTFTVALTLLAIYSPARAAASMDPAKALREYVYLEDTRPSKKRGAIIAFSLGLYKLIILLLGINFQNIGRFLFGVNFLFAIVLIILAILDFGLNIIGPFLFLYGATQLSTGLAIRFHERFASLSKRLVGDIASLASKSVFRNPRRVTALVFLVALIAGYSIWVIGDLASVQDYNYRQAEVAVGSDLHASGRVPLNLTYPVLVANQLRTWNNITGATPEFDTSVTLSSRAGFLQVKAIDPATWRQGAYYETDWFGGNIDADFQNLQSNTQSIVLDRGVASYYNILQGGTVSANQTVNLTVINFFGPDYSQQSSGQPFGFSYFQPEGWSFVPLSLVSQYPTLFSGSGSVLVKARPGVSLTDLAASIQKVYPSLTVSTAQDYTQGAVPVVSNAPQASAQSAGAVIASGTQNVLRLGTVFAGLAASIGIGAVAYTGFKEREKETTMLAVRG